MYETSILAHWGPDKMSAISQKFSNAFSWTKTYEFKIKVSPKFVPKSPINKIPALIQVMAWCLPGDKPLSEPMMVSLPTNICVTHPNEFKEDFGEYLSGGIVFCRMLIIAHCFKYDFSYKKKKYFINITELRVSRFLLPNILRFGTILPYNTTLQWRNKTVNASQIIKTSTASSRAYRNHQQGNHQSFAFLVLCAQNAPLNFRPGDACGHPWREW